MRSEIISTFFDRLRLDIRAASRSLLAHSTVSVVAILLIATGIAANTAVFSLLDTVLLARLPVQDPDGLFQLIVTHRSATHNLFSYGNYEGLRDEFPIFDELIAWSSYDVELEVDGSASKAHMALVSENYWQMLGLQPQLGRLHEDGDDMPGASTAVLGFDFWQHDLRGDVDIIGKAIELNGAPFTVIGVGPRGFGGAELDYPRDIYTPILSVSRIWPSQEFFQDRYWLSILVRLRPHLSPIAAEADLKGTWERFLASKGQRPADGWTPRITLAPGATGVSFYVRDQAGEGLVVLSVLVALILLVACANVSGLLLVRATGLRGESALRLAFGASRWRLVSYWFTESGLIVLIGGVLGIFAARWVGQGLLVFLPEGQGGFLDVELNLTMLAYAVAAITLTFLLAGVLPALGVSDLSPALVIKELGSRGGGGRTVLLVRGIVVGQIAICSVLIFGAFLFAESLRNVSNLDTGFDRKDILILNSNLNESEVSGDELMGLTRRAVEELGAVPGVETSTFSKITPLSGSMWWGPAVVPSYELSPNELTTVYINAVGQNYFRTWGIPILKGREFEAFDRYRAVRSAIVSKSFAAHYFDGDAMGKRFSVGHRDDELQNLEIVGVVADTVYSDPRETARECVYVAGDQLQSFRHAVHIRLKAGISGGGGVASDVRRVAQTIYGTPPDLRPVEELFDRVTHRDRLVSYLAATFGTLGLFLSCIGLYGVVSYTLALRRRETTVRMALGAQRIAILRRILIESALMATAGVAIGLSVALASGSLIAKMLYDMDPASPLALAGTAAAMVLAAILMTLPAAFRTALLNPASTLRY